MLVGQLLGVSDECHTGKEKKKMKRERPVDQHMLA